jgi:hypothetical protein
MHAFYGAALGFDLDKDLAEMVNGDITVHDKPGRDEAPAQGKSPQSKPNSSPRGRMCPAMSQQRTDIGNEAAPQKFIRLIGSRDSRSGRSAVALAPALVPRS